LVFARWLQLIKLIRKAHDPISRQIAFFLKAEDGR
jgi:hypothetical protein